MTKSTPSPRQLAPTLNGRPAQLASVHDAGLVELPPEVVSAIVAAAALRDALNQARAGVEDRRRGYAAARPAAVERLRTEGPLPAPAAGVRTARVELANAIEDAAVIKTAADGSALAIASTVRRHALAIRDDLAAALVAILDRSRSLAPLVSGLDLRDPDAVHEAPDDVAAAFHELVPLAAASDRIRVAALALYQELAVARTEAASRAALESFDLAWFVGGGLVGPVDGLRGTGDPRYFRDWTWKPGSTHPVARLVDAVRLAQLDDQAADQAAAGLDPIAVG